jgi:hypothetical protein
MYPRSRNKPLVICIAIVASVFLAGAGALLDGLAPRASLAGFFMRTIPLAVVIPFVLVGFNALCDRCDGRPTNRIALDGQSRWDDRSTQHDAYVADRRRIAVHERSFRSVVPGKKSWVGQ